MKVRAGTVWQLHGNSRIDVFDTSAQLAELRARVDSIRVWAEAATLTKSAVPYNAGTLNRARQAGVRQVEAFDGGDCG
ncbi:hypothetical protein [Streptomyces sp. NPDC059063]|uniref:hypothetical protein n=1 Tax=unclassified Streptomyces TaxID=2593676 RepID=UPI003681D5E3